MISNRESSAGIPADNFFFDLRTVTELSVTSAKAFDLQSVSGNRNQAINLRNKIQLTLHIQT